MADEASDSSNQQQLSFILRFVNKDGELRKQFLGFLHYELGLSGKALAETILTEIGNLTLDINNCRGRGYDGAVSVSTHILKINKKAAYTHCCSHRLNLVVAESCSIQDVRNVLDQIKELSFFFNFSEPHQKMLDLSIENHAPDCLKKKLKNVCRTRWVEQITGLDDFEDLYISIVFCLESVSINEGRVCNRETSTKASSFYKLIASFDFIETLVLTRSIFDLTLPVTELLQRKEIDMADASHLLDSLKSVILSKRNTVDDFRNNYYRIILEMANKVSINETKAAFQKNFNNVPAESVSGYF